MRAALCWWTDPAGEACDAELLPKDGRWVCPYGHRLRQYDDLSPWLRDHLAYVASSPRVIAWVCDGRGEKPL